uniref:Uncharacterized protein n=1 Tax=Anguilla anguilla TaxID=7936 RepID=A0A0E9P555_ANGAN
MSSLPTSLFHLLIYVYMHLNGYTMLLSQTIHMLHCCWTCNQYNAV